MWIILAFVFIIASPFLGMGASWYAFGVALVRPSLISAGYLFSDSCGYGAFVRTWARYIAWKRAARGGGAAAATAAALSPYALRSPALAPLELVLPAPPPAGYTTGHCCTGSPGYELADAAIRVSGWFNAGFSAGYLGGSVVVVGLTFIAAPFVGAGAAGYQFFAALWRATAARADGRLLTDALGVSELLEQSTAAMAEEMAPPPLAQQEQQQRAVAAQQPFYGGAPPPPPPPGSWAPPHPPAGVYPGVPAPSYAPGASFYPVQAAPTYYPQPGYAPPAAQQQHLPVAAVVATDPQPPAAHEPLLPPGVPSGGYQGPAVPPQWK